MAFSVLDTKTGETLHPATVAVTGSGTLLIYDRGWRVTYDPRYVTTPR